MEIKRDVSTPSVGVMVLSHILQMREKEREREREEESTKQKFLGNLS